MKQNGANGKSTGSDIRRGDGALLAVWVWASQFFFYASGSSSAEYGDSHCLLALLGETKWITHIVACNTLNFMSAHSRCFKVRVKNPDSNTNNNNSLHSFHEPENKKLGEVVCTSLYQTGVIKRRKSMNNGAYLNYNLFFKCYLNDAKVCLETYLVVAVA